MPGLESERRDFVSGDGAANLLRGVAAAVAVWERGPAGVELTQADPAATCLLGDPGAHGELRGELQRALSSRSPVDLGVLTSDALGEPTTYLVRLVPLDARRTAQVWIEAPGAEPRDPLRQVAAALAHDFNNLLQVAEGNLELALTAPPTVGRVEAALGALIRARELTSQLLAFATPPGSGGVPVELGDVAHAAIPELRDAVPATTVFSWAIPTGGPTVLAEPGHVRQVLRNLLRNALQSLQGGVGEVAVGVGVCEVHPHDVGYVRQRVPAPGRYGYVEVADNGPGLDPAALQAVFEPFAAPSSTRRVIDLPAVVAIAEIYGGAVRVRTAPGEGTVVRVVFPLHRAEPTESEPEPIPTEALEYVVGTALVVDDEDPVRELVASALERNGFHVHRARDGESAIADFLRLARDGVLDVVVLDLTMPRMSGVEAFRLMARTDSSIPVLLTSGFSPTEVARRVGELQPASILQKPAPMYEIVDRVRRLVARRHGRHPPS